MSEGNELTEYESRVKVIENLGPLDMIDVGQYWWVDDKDYKGEPTGTYLMCLTHIGSNHVCFRGKEINRATPTCTIHFDEFEERCKHEPNAMVILRKEAIELQSQIQEKMDAMIEMGEELCLLQNGKNTASESTALVTTAKDPKVYKNELITFRDNLPGMHKEIDELSSELAGTYKLMTESQKTKVGKVYGALSIVEDRIFTVELYCGLLEEVHLVKDGEPAGRDERIAIRQQMLYMDEETLFDYDTGGMDFSDITKFDEWVARPENMARILPEQKGIVAFRIRRNQKDYTGYGLHSWTKISWERANMVTYLLIRNGEKIYRVSPEIDFSPRLVPFRDEFGEKKFRKRRSRTVERKPGDPGFNPKHKPGFPFNTRHETYYEDIGPNDLEYDRHAKELERSIQHYNRMIILLQGLLDRSAIFAPHSGIKLTDSGQVDKWIHLIRDEEDTLPGPRVDLDQWLAENNEGSKKGQWIYSNITDPKSEGRGYDANTRPRVVQISGVRRDGSEVKVSWPWGHRYGYEHGDWGKYGEWPVNKMCHQWIPAGSFVNLNHYELGAYKQFLCDRSLKGEYLEWGPFLLNAEDWRRQQIIEGKDIMEATKSKGRISKKRKKTVIVEVEEEQKW